MEQKRLVLIMLKLWRSWAWRVGGFARYPAQRQIDPSAPWEQARCPGINPVNAVESKPGGAAESDDVAGREPDRSRWVAALLAADPEQTGVSQ
jgi:hypothetical protein